MSKISIEGNASGTGTITIAAPNTNSNATLTLPTASGTVVTTAGAQTIEFAAGTSAAPLCVALQPVEVLATAGRAV